MARSNLRSSSDILRLLNRTIHQLEAGEITNNTAKTMTYICSTAGSIIKNLELEKRIDELEKLAEEKEGKV